MSGIIELGPWDLGLAALLVLALAGTSLALRLGFARPLVVSAARMVVQLLLVGVVLEALFASPHPAWVALASVVMLGVAGYEVMARQKHRVRGMAGYAIGTGALFVSSFALTAFALLAVIQPEPFYAPRYAIPVLGMLLGNTMNAVALAADRLTTGATQQRAIIEQRLLLGETKQEATAELRRDSLRSGMIPVVNAMAAAGIVSLPGMMTGQILAGNDPTDAVLYQILIWLLIAAGTGFGQLVAVHLISNRLFDERHRLRLERLG